MTKTHGPKRAQPTRHERLVEACRLREAGYRRLGVAMLLRVAREVIDDPGTSPEARTELEVLLSSITR